MATYTITGGGTTGLSSSAPKVRVASVVVDFSSTTNAAGDVFECIEVPANSYVVTAGVDIITVGTGSGTISLGDGADVDRYVAAVVMTAAGQKTIVAQAGTSVMGTTSAGYGIYAAADTIDIVTATAAVNGVCRVWAVIADVDGLGDSQGQKVTFA